MSMMICENCDQNIDTDYNAEHFDECGNDDIEIVLNWQQKGYLIELLGSQVDQDWTSGTTKVIINQILTKLNNE